MAVYAIVIMVILAIVMAVFIILSILKEDSNNKKNQHNIIYPFNAKLQSRDKDHPDGGYDVALLASDGQTPQLQCPAGTHIEVIGAWSDVVDPNGICSNKPTATFKLSCGFTRDASAGVQCQTETDCAPGMTCSGSQQCVPKPCSSNEGCGSAPTACLGQYADIGKACSDHTFAANDGLVCIDGVVHRDPSAGQCLYCDTRRWPEGAPADSYGNIGYCAQSPSCANTGGQEVLSPQNPTCTGAGCVPRDASAYLAEQCNGKRNCKIVWNPTNPTYFGPKACNIAVNWDAPTQGPGISGGGVVPSYEQLPVAAGWDGGQPGTGQQQGSPQPATYSQGLYVHGIFSCIPDST
jgi:hypothetical protein